jgi:endonuclease YncB( thermonuclease family)
LPRLFFLLVPLVFNAPCSAQTITGKVVSISDGDTITVLDASRTQHKIRLAGIDAPEKRQAFGNVSKQNLARMVFQKEVTVD